MSKKPTTGTFDPLATMRVHLQGLRDYAQQVNESELAREVARQMTVLDYAWGKGTDPHEDVGEPTKDIEAAFRRLAYVTCTLMIKQRGHGE